LKKVVKQHVQFLPSYVKICTICRPLGREQRKFKREVTYTLTVAESNFGKFKIHEVTRIKLLLIRFFLEDGWC
jgi:hypothetical protein